MRTSFLSRAVIMTASLAISSVALAATPATAASASGVTQEQVLTAVNGVRAADAAGTSYSKATGRALAAIARSGCDVRVDSFENMYLNSNVLVTTAGDDAEGLMLSANVSGDFMPESYTCTIAAFATTDSSFQLSGTATFSGQEWDETAGTGVPVILQTAPLSGDVFVTAPLETGDRDVYEIVASASGNATKTTAVTTTHQVTDAKTASVKKAAKKKYDKQLKSAKKSYKKAVTKAGKNKSKKSKAKKAYSAKTKSAKAAHKKAIAPGFKNVSTTTYNVENRPFSATAPTFEP